MKQFADINIPDSEIENCKSIEDFKKLLLKQSQYSYVSGAEHGLTVAKSIMGNRVNRTQTMKRMLKHCKEDLKTIKIEINSNKRTG